MESLPWKMSCGTVVTTWLPSPTGVPPSARKDLGFFHTTELGSSASVDWWIYAPNRWGSRGSLPVVWQGWTWKPLQQKYDTKCTQNLSLCQAPKRNIGNCVANVWCCLTISEALKNDTSWHHGFFWNFQVTILKLLKYLDLPFLPRVGTQFPKCALLLRSSTFPGLPAQGITKAQGLSLHNFITTIQV